MKATLLIVVLALCAAAALLWEGEGPDLPTPGPGERQEEGTRGPMGSPSDDRSPPEQPAAQLPPDEAAAREPGPAPPPEVTQPPEAAQPTGWQPTMREFLDAGMTGLQAEILLEGLTWVRAHAPEGESLADAIEKGSVQDIAARAVQLLGPKLTELIEDGGLAVKCHERKERMRRRVSCDFHARRATGGEVDRFQFIVEGTRGVLALVIPPRLLDPELVQAMGAPRNR